MKLVSRIEARRIGAKRYFLGTPCKEGHIAERHVTSCVCMECARIRRAVFRQENPEHMKALAAKLDRKELARKAIIYRAKHRERDRRLAWIREGKPMPTRPMPEVCECCGGRPNGIGSLHLDHCHETGRFRGWLCYKCNAGLGMLRDNVIGILLALDYLQRAES